MPLPQEKLYTSNDYWSLPDGQRAELIDGKLYNMAPPNRMHQKLVTKFVSLIENHIAAHHGDCEVYPAPFAVNLDANDKIWIEPDLSVICDKQKLTNRGCKGAPDWIIEIVSPSSIRMDYSVKLFKYRTAGVREYWIVNPIKQTVQTYSFENEEDAGHYSFEDEISAKVLEGFTVRICELLENF
ncbi:MAG: Uma2 family endonuclease [Eubacterium sp.]|nr:Uma2 family endonuclease [Eubacterium sp.]